MAATVRQAARGFAAAAGLTVAATLASAALARSALVFVVVGDKDVGTYTRPSGWLNDAEHLPANLRATDVSLIVNWHDSGAGGQTLVSGSVATNVAGSQIWLLEVTDPNSGPWHLRAHVEHNTDGTNVTAWSTGTSSAATQAGQGVAVVGADSVNTEGTVSWSNSWVAGANTPSGSTQAGLWGSLKAVAAAATSETTLTRTGGTADQHSGALIVLSRDPAGDGSQTMGALTAAGTGNVRRLGTGAQTMAALVAAGTGAPIVNVDGAGLALFGALAASGRGIDPPPTDLPLRTGQPTLAASWSTGEPELATSWSAGTPVLR